MIEARPVISGDMQQYQWRLVTSDEVERIKGKIARAFPRSRVMSVPFADERDSTTALRRYNLKETPLLATSSDEELTQYEETAVETGARPPEQRSGPDIETGEAASGGGVAEEKFLPPRGALAALAVHLTDAATAVQALASTLLPSGAAAAE